ncbi:MAG: class I SAM-dependent methyltransferase [Chitinophagales bacterium]|nr:class I SAM-dependent methyltransferase [Chitinophagales bacterium]MDW8274127.1 class I SAM-dependent methyltransferase [Chitinophagales bacterium]
MKDKPLVLEKKNVSVFNKDVLENKGYRYTQNAPYSSYVANLRQTQETLKLIGDAKTLIDIGCGDGTYTAEIAQARLDLKISGFDPAHQAIELARQKHSGIDFRVANLLDANSLPQEEFDVGVIRGVLHHLTDPPLAIENAARIAKKLIIIEPNGNNPILKIIEKTSRYHIEHEERSFSQATLKRWCREKGLKVESLTVIGFVPFFFPTIPAKIIYFFQPFLELFWPLKKYFGAQIVIVATRNA